MDDKVEQIRKRVLEAAASIKMDKLPLSDEYIVKYIEKRLKEIKDKEKEKGPVLVLK